MTREKNGTPPDVEKLAMNLGPLDVNALIKAMPGIAAMLGGMMASEALPLMAKAGLWLDRAQPEVRILFNDPASGVEFAIALSIEEIEDEPETETEGS